MRHRARGGQRSRGRASGAGVVGPLNQEQRKEKRTLGASARPPSDPELWLLDPLQARSGRPGAEKAPLWGISTACRMLPAPEATRLCQQERVV